VGRSGREAIEAQAASFPAAAGVYLFKDARGRVLYVGKADSLRDRVRSYFGPSLDVRHVRLVERADRLEYVRTAGVAEAFLLENNLIKQHKPRYNIRLKDDKSYPYVKVTLGEDFPRIIRTRSLGDRSARYFGPYANAKSVDQTLDLLQKLFPYRNCKLTIVADAEGLGHTVPRSALPNVRASSSTSNGATRRATPGRRRTPIGRRSRGASCSSRGGSTPSRVRPAPRWAAPPRRSSTSGPRRCATS
jgi:hypothetical protein